MFSKKEVDKINKHSLKDRIGEIKKDRNVFLVVAIVIGVTSIYQSFSISNVVENTQRTREVVYIKVEPNGSHSISEFLPESEQPISTTMVNSLLNHYISVRYGINKETIERDYSEAYIFMSPKLGSLFMDEKGFNARGKIKEVISSNNIDSVKVRVTNYDHYDVIEGQFNGTKKPIIRSVVEFEKTIISPDNKVKEKKQMRLKVQWTLLERAELSRQNLDWLNINPIGMVILDQQEEEI